jgi:hypothetical protein
MLQDDHNVELPTPLALRTHWVDKYPINSFETMPARKFNNPGCTVAYLHRCHC